MSIGSELPHKAYEILVGAKSIRDPRQHHDLANQIALSLIEERERAAKLLDDAANTVPASHPAAMDIRRVLRALALDIRRGDT